MMLGWGRTVTHRLIRLCVKRVSRSFVFRSCVMWRSAKQSLPSASITEAECQATASAKQMTDNAAAVPASMQYAPFKITVPFDTQAPLVIDNGERRWRTLPLLNIIEVRKIAYCRTNHLSALCGRNKRQTSSQISWVRY